MDIKRLTHFIALAEEGRFARAATRVHLSQAAFSRSIQTLEASMGLRLFDRGAKGASLTPAGEVVLRRAMDLVFDSRCLERDLELVKLGDMGEISIGAAPIPAAVLVPDLLCQLRQQSPHLVTRVHLGNLPKLLSQLDAQELDFCLGDPRLVEHNLRYEMAPMGRQMAGLFCRRGHPLARKGLADKPALCRYGVAVISISPGLGGTLSAAYGFAMATEFPLAVECDDIHTLVHLVTHSDVLGVLPQAVVERNPKPLVRLQTVGSQASYADIYAIWLKGRTLSPAAQRAIALTQQLGAKTPTA
jgi:DNA-binding transcriptional LysR family regulator